MATDAQRSGTGPSGTDARTGAPSGHGDASDLVRARDALLDPPPGARRLGPGALREAFVELHDFWLSSRAASVGVGEGSALVAVGALGRRELAPHSDLDLVLVHDGRGRRGDKERISRVADALWYPLWDAGIGLDHSVRTVGEAIEVATTDLRVALGLLEVRPPRRRPGPRRAPGRHGPPGVARGHAGTASTTSSPPRRRAGSARARSRTASSPTSRTATAGLRDIQLLDALSAAQLVDRPTVDVQDARRLMLDLRVELHRRAGRARDVMQAEDAHEVVAAAAADLGVTDRFDLARALSGAARTVVFATDTALRSARSALPRRGLAALRRPPARRPLDDGVVEHAGEVVLARDAQVSRDPALVLRLAATAARTELPIAAGTLHRLADAAPELREPWPRAALSELLALLGAGEGTVDVIEALDRTGLWGRLFPEWGAVRDLPPRDRSHVWTVDRHLVEVTRRAAELTTQVVAPRPAAARRAGARHRQGPRRGPLRGRRAPRPPHRAAPRALARGRRDARRDGAPPPAAAAHRVAARPGGPGDRRARRRDPRRRPGPARAAARPRRGRLARHRAGGLDVVAGDADGRPGAPLPRRHVRRDRCPARRRCPTRPIDLARAVAESGRPEVSISGEGELTTITMTVAAPDRPGLLSRAAGVLALHSLQVHTADLGEHDGVAVDAFTVSPRFGRLPEASLLREDLVRVLRGSLDLPARLAAKERDYDRPGPAPAPSRVLWFDDEATGAVVLELRTSDRIGLLHRVGRRARGAGARRPVGAGVDAGQLGARRVLPRDRGAPGPRHGPPPHGRGGRAGRRRDRAVDRRAARGLSPTSAGSGRTVTSRRLGL